MKDSNRFFAIFLLFGLSFATTQCITPGAPTQGTPKLKAYFGSPRYSSVTLSPDGQNIAYLADNDGVLNIWVASIHSIAEPRVLTQEKARSVVEYFWSIDSRTILFLKDENGNEKHQLMAVDLNQKGTRNLSSTPGARTIPIRTSEKFPRSILIGTNSRDERFFDLYLLDIDSGKKSLVYLNEHGLVGFKSDEDLALRFALSPREDGGQDVIEFKDSKPIKRFWNIDFEDAATTHLLNLSKSGRLLFAMDSRTRDTSALVKIDLNSSKTSILAEDPQSDVDEVLIDPKTEEIQAVSFNYLRSEWKILDPSLAPIFKALKQIDPGVLKILSRDKNDQLWLVAFDNANSPGRYFLVDRKAGKTRFLFSNNPGLESLPLSPMYSQTIKARDGLLLTSYLSLPKGLDADSDGIPDHPLPTVVMVHSGPWIRDTWGYDPVHQWLTSRGYAVLSVNFRGSSGFGKKFMEKGNQQWAAKMQDDVLDGVQWAIQSKIADSQRLAIMGSSYGGFATFSALSQHPKIFACGVSLAGASNLITLLASIPPSWTPMIEQMARRIGDSRTENGRKLLVNQSPLTHAHRIERPLLIAQGAQDPRVKPEEADQIIKALQKKQVEVTYLLYPDEGHGLEIPANRMSFYGVADNFLSKCLCGPGSDLRDVVKGSSLTVPFGSKFILGLPEALAK